MIKKERKGLGFFLGLCRNYKKKKSPKRHREKNEEIRKIYIHNKLKKKKKKGSIIFQAYLAEHVVHLRVVSCGACSQFLI